MYSCTVPFSTSEKGMQQGCGYGTLGLVASDSDLLDQLTIIGLIVPSGTNSPIIFWARAGGKNAPCDHMRAHPPRLGTYMDIQRSAGGTSCPTTRVGGLARGTLGALANIGLDGWLAGNRI